MAEPLAELLVEIVEVSEAKGEEEVLQDVTEWSLYFTPIWPNRLDKLWADGRSAGNWLAEKRAQLRPLL